MADYSELTDAEKADVAIFERFVRSQFAALNRVARDADIPTWVAFAASVVNPILAKLDPAALIPNSTGYAGAKDLTVADFVALQTLTVTLSTMLAQNRPLIVKAVGVNS